MPAQADIYLGRPVLAHALVEARGFVTADIHRTDAEQRFAQLRLRLRFARCCALIRALAGLTGR
jgi:hypothetical protein